MTELDMWKDMVQEEYPGLQDYQYDNMKNVAAIYYYFGPDNNWNPNNTLGGSPEHAALFEKFLVYKSLKQTNQEEY
jgi:hypothetical protein